MCETTIQFLWQNRSISPEFRAGVSLHSHTMYSEESLEILPRYTRKVPFLGNAVCAESDRFHNTNHATLDFSHAFWTPPLSPRQAHRLEQKQIQQAFNLPGLVSITDHDDIRAGSHLRVLDDFRHAPVSTEWTIPFGPTFFHLGVHNLPVEAPAIMGRLQAFTSSPSDNNLSSILDDLNSLTNVLVVLNHPLWDEKGIGASEHGRALGRLLESQSPFIHALEVNGLRSWKENQKVISLGRHLGLPSVSGGDRHGLEPNAIVNLSRSSTLSDFIREIREDRRSCVIFMPQYKEPLKMRVLQTMVDVVRDYPENLEGRRHWSDRVFFRPESGANPVPVASFWGKGAPFLATAFVNAMRLAEYRGIRSALRMALHDSSVWSDQEASI
jgi:hypothetical protein